MFGPDKEYCQHFADMASAGRIKWTLFCSVCSKLKASQFICSRRRLTGASYSHRNTVEREGGGARKRIREISFFPKKRQSFSVLFKSALSCCEMETESEREVKTDSLRRGEERLRR